MRNVLLIMAAAISVLGCLCSCTKIVRCSVEEASARQTQFQSGQPRISAVITPDADTIVFDSLGGLYDSASQTLVGISKDGTPVGFLPSTMEKIRLVLPDGTTIDMDRLEMSIRCRGMRREKIEGLRLKGSLSQIGFAKYGAWVHTSRRLVVNSFPWRQQPRVYPFEEIAFVMTEELDLALLAGLAAVCFVYLIMTCDYWEDGPIGER